MRLLVCGGRGFADEPGFNRLMGTLIERPSVVIHGGARGADRMAGRWALNHGIPAEVYEADWDRDGKAAGPIRNARMLAEGKPDLVLALPGGRGTADMVAKAEAAGVPVVMAYSPHTP